LKDASATALYGTRAANGVIVITTKQGKPGPPTVSYGFTGTLTRRSRYSDRNVNVMNALERIDYSREAVEKGLSYSNISSWVGYEAALMDYYSGKLSHQEFIEKVSFYESNNTDWFDIICRDAFSHNHNLSISGGSANMKYYASLGYSRENGVLKKEQSDRYTAMMRLNLNYDKFTMSFGLSGNVLEKQYTPSEVGLMTYAYNTSRGVPAYNEDGSMWYYPYTFSGQTYPVNYNILQEREHSSQEMNSSGLSLTAQLGYKIFPSLKAEATFSYTINNSDQETYFGDKSAYAANLRGEKYDGTIVAKNNFMPFGAELRKENTKNTNYMLRGQLNYTKFLDEAQDHMITASVGGELSSTKYTGIKQTHRGYLKDRGMLISTFDAGSYPDLEKWLVSTADARGILKDQLTNSVSGYATVSYSYMNKYILNANMRIDASNKFGSRANDKLLPVWSVSARWNMKEDLMPHWTWVNTLSWRASFGYQGNMLDSESPELIIKKGDLHTQMDSYRSTIHKFPNPNLSWEKTASFNTTVDFSFFKSRVRGSFSYFYKKTKNAFLSKKISVVNGVRQYTVNQGTVENTGVEFAFQLYPIPPGLGAAGGGKRGFTWRIDPQLGQVLNKLINKATENKKGDRTLHDDYTYEDYLSGNAQVAGRPLNSFFSYEFTGLNPKNGAPTFARIGEENWEQYAEMTNDGVCLTVMDYSGCRVPYLQGGISNTFGYRQFTLSFNLTYSIGSKVRLMKLYDNTSSNVSAPQPVQNLRRELVDRWRKPGDEKRTNIPGILSNADYKETIDSPWWKKENSYKFGENIWQMYNNADVRVVSGNYLKLQSLSLRYSLPDDLCKKMRVSAMYLAFSTSNLFTWSAKELKGQDPTSQSGSSSSISVPVLPSYTLNLNVSF
jgi:tonB-linked outer membrane protein, susC/ragA family